MTAPTTIGMRTSGRAPVESDLALLEKAQHAADGGQREDDRRRSGTSAWMRSTGLTGCSITTCDSPGAEPL